MERVRRPAEFDDLMSHLGGPAKSSEAFFESLKSVLIFAAALAIKKGLPPRPFDKSGERIPYGYFNGDFEEGFISAMALSISEDVSVLHPDSISYRLKIFEEMASAGLYEISRSIQDTQSEDSYFLSVCSSAELDSDPVARIFDDFDT